MCLLESIPAVLQVVHDAEDELAALTGACRWARDAGATFVAIVGGDGCATLAMDAARGDEVSVEERQEAARVMHTHCLTHRDEASVLAVARYAGVRVGVIIVRGERSRVAMLTELGTTLAALSGPAVRARLDATALMARAHGSQAEIIGDSPAIAGLREAIARCAVTPFPVLVEGESGTGKELVARAVHRLSPRRDRRFAAINCAALTDELVDAELFGHARGAFTGAVGPRAGLFEDANGGSLFLDEVGELSARAQAKLLRALQEREVRRVGENVARPVDARVIAATNRSLPDMAARGLFRDDLLFRLGVVRLRLPPLRDRPEDIPAIARACWTRVARDAACRAVIGPDALARLIAHPWPGNVRELQNVLAGLVLVAPPRGRVTSRHVEAVLVEAGSTRQPPPVSLERARVSCERRTVAAALARHGGRRTAAARELGLSRQGLSKALRRLRLGRDRPHEGVASTRPLQP
jgi:transcriptional regulator with GAF, ATPase, and Fis domain